MHRYWLLWAAKKKNYIHIFKKNYQNNYNWRKKPYFLRTCSYLRTWSLVVREHSISYEQTNGCSNINERTNGRKNKKKVHDRPFMVRKQLWPHPRYCYVKFWVSTFSEKRHTLLILPGKNIISLFIWNNEFMTATL